MAFPPQDLEGAFGGPGGATRSSPFPAEPEQAGVDLRVPRVKRLESLIDADRAPRSVDQGVEVFCEG